MRQNCKKRIATVQEVMRNLLGRDYELGGYKEEGPLDCWGLVREYTIKSYGFDIVEYTSDKKVTSYPDEYKLFPKDIIDEFSSFIKRIYIGISKGYVESGDIIIAKGEERDTIGIYGSNDSMLVTGPGSGSFFIKLSTYISYEAYRWPLQSQ